MAGDTIFGLAVADLAPVVERAVAARVTPVSIAFRHEPVAHPGKQSETRIPTITYTTPDGGTGEVTLFAKRHIQSEPIEGSHYAHLLQHGAPVPALYGAMRDEEGREVLFVEHLDTVYSAEEVYGTPDLLRELIRLAARLNRLPTDEAYESLYRHGAVHPIPAAQVPVVQRIAAWAEASGDGGALASLFLERDAELAAQLEALGEAVSAFPMGFVHGDFFPHHMARRSDGEMLVIDLGVSLFASRFFDVAPFVGPSDDLPELCLSREEIATVYLDAYDAGATSLPDFLAEADAVWLAWNSRRLGWEAEQAMAGDPRAQAVVCRLAGLLLDWRDGEPLIT